MKKAAGPCRPADTGQHCVLCVGLWLSVCKSQKLLPSHIHFPSPADTPVQKYVVLVGVGIWNINTFFPFLFFYTLPQIAHISLQIVFKQPLLNLIKDITDNRRAIKQQCFQRSVRAYIAVAQRVTAVSLISLWSLKATPPHRVQPPHLHLQWIRWCL